MSEKAYMLNVLWFEEDGGAEKYAEYAAAAALRRARREAVALPE